MPRPPSPRARTKFPDGYKIAPHWHPGIEHVTVVSGTFNLGLGDKFDDSKGNAMPAGSFGYLVDGDMDERGEAPNRATENPGSPDADLEATRPLGVSNLPCLHEFAPIQGSTELEKRSRDNWHE